MHGIFDRERVQALEDIAKIAKTVCDLKHEYDWTLHVWTAASKIHDEKGRAEALGQIESVLTPTIWQLGQALERLEPYAPPPPLPNIHLGKYLGPPEAA